MRVKAIMPAVLLILALLISGCSKGENNVTLPLEFVAVSKVAISELQADSVAEIIQERKINDSTRVVLFTNQNKGEISGGIKLNEKLFYFGEVSIEGTPEDLMGIEEIQVFGKKAIKISGKLGANYAHAFYWFMEENLQESIIQVAGNTMEIDLDGDGKQEIISTVGTIPETSIFILEGDKIVVSNINKSIGAEAVYPQEKGEPLFEVYFEPNKPEQYEFYRDSNLKNLVKKREK